MKYLTTVLAHFCLRKLVLFKCYSCDEQSQEFCCHLLPHCINQRRSISTTCLRIEDTCMSKDWGYMHACRCIGFSLFNTRSIKFLLNIEFGILLHFYWYTFRMLTSTGGSFFFRLLVALNYFSCIWKENKINPAKRKEVVSLCSQADNIKGPRKSGKNFTRAVSSYFPLSLLSSMLSSTSNNILVL